MGAKGNGRFGSRAADYADVQREMAAQRRALTARMRAGATADPRDDVESARPPHVTEAELPESPLAPSPALDEWLVEIGWSQRKGLEATRRAVATAIEAGPANLTVCLSWPSPHAAAILAWAGRSLAGEGDSFGDARILFAGMASNSAKLLGATYVERRLAARPWRPTPSKAMSARRDAMATAFLPQRLKADAPVAFPCADLVPLLHVNARDGAEPWAPKWKGFLKSGRSFVERGHGGRYGLPRDHFGETKSSRPFGFIVPRTSVGHRREAEIQAIPGTLDAVILDLSPRWMGPWNVVEALESALVDLKIACGKVALPPVVVLVSDPRCALAAMRMGAEARTHDIVVSTHLTRTLYLGFNDGAHHLGHREEPVRVVVHAAATHEAEIVEALLELAERIQSEHPETAEALASAADTLSAMAHTTRPPLADGSPIERRFTFVDAEERVFDALRREGDLPQRSAIERALNAGRDSARRLMRDTPARMALREAMEAAVSGSKVAFVTDQAGDAVEGRLQAPAGLIVASRNEAFTMLAGESLDRLVLACRGADALRLLVELPKPGREVVFVLAPNEAATAGRIAEHLVSWPEFVGVRPRCAALITALPPTLGRLLALAAKAPVTRGTKPNKPVRSDTAFRSAAEVIVLFDDGAEEGFAAGSEVVVLDVDAPCVKPATELVEGDLVVLPPQAVSDDVAREMGWDGEAALLDEEVGRYKSVLAAWLRGPGRGMTANSIVSQLRAIDPAMSAPHASTVRYWLSAARAQLDPAPRASTDPQWFAAFCKIIGYGGGDSHALGDHFDDHRAKLRRDGKLRRCLVERFIFDRYDATLHHDIPLETVETLRRRLLSYVRAVAEVHRGGWGTEP